MFVGKLDVYLVVFVDDFEFVFECYLCLGVFVICVYVEVDGVKVFGVGGVV